MKKGNPVGYELELPKRKAHDHCAIDTETLLSYCQGTKAIFAIVRVISSNRFWGPVYRSRIFEIGFPLSRGGCTLGNGRNCCHGLLDATIDENSSNG